MAKDKIVPLGVYAPLGSKIKVYNDIEEMKSDASLMLGQIVQLFGTNSKADGTGHQRIVASEDNGSGVQLGNGLWANIIDNSYGVNKDDIKEISNKVEENSVLSKASSGVSKVLYIQDAGEKTAGNGYVDKVTGKLYLCKTTTTDTDVTSNFSLATNIENSSRLDNSFRFFSENYSGQNIAFEVIWIDTDNSSSTGEIDISSFKNISKFLFANIYDGAETPQGQLSKYINIYKVTNTKLYWKSDTSLLGSFRVLAIGIGN